MLAHDLLTLIGQGEGAKLEFKRDGERPEKIAKEIVAFANINGGIVLIGVEDDGEIVGIHKSNLQAWLMDTVIGQYIHPSILPDYEEVMVEGKKVAIITIPQGSSKPYVVRQQHREDIYVRYGDTSQLAKREHVARLYHSGGLLSAEKFPVHGSTIEDLDERRYKEYFQAMLHFKPTDSSQNLSGTGSRDCLHELLVDYDFLVGESDPSSCSYFSYVLFAKEPKRLAQAGARLTVYSGQDKEYDSIFDKMYKMPFLEYRGEGGIDDPVEPALHQRIFDDIRSRVSHEKLRGAVRVPVWDYPAEAIRELLINAFTHRDWTKQDYVRVVLYSDRMEITSPGSLPNGMTIEKIKNGVQSQRNPMFIRVFRDYGYLEDQGIGIRRRVIPQMEEYNGCSPDFEATEDYFKVTLRKKEE
ncbi:MAG: putative DNA binding domain-containing protein [Gammaproteobacteria bacterium]|nr:putative DNA binding domain-containing protein [Gammaproteobacteria bacterium]